MWTAGPKRPKCTGSGQKGMCSRPTHSSPTKKSVTLNRPPPRYSVEMIQPNCVCRWGQSCIWQTPMDPYTSMEMTATSANPSSMRWSWKPPSGWGIDTDNAKSVKPLWSATSNNNENIASVKSLWCATSNHYIQSLHTTKKEQTNRPSDIPPTLMCHLTHQ